jgi:hypothetical protein
VDAKPEGWVANAITVEARGIGAGAHLRISIGGNLAAARNGSRSTHIGLTKARIHPAIS